MNMSEKTERLFEGITDIRDDLIEGVEGVSLRKKPIHWQSWTALAACAVLILGIGGTALLRSGFGGNAGSGGSGGHAESSMFMSYAGPVFPLAAINPTEGITAQRDVTYDFSLLSSQIDWDTQYHLRRTEHNVTDTYVLTNETRQTLTVLLSYPSTGSLSDAANRLPSLTVDGQAADADIYAGPYSGVFASAHGVADSEETLNLDEPHSWEIYQTLLQDGSYRADAMSDFPALDQPVTIYEFTGETADHEAYPAATLAVDFTASMADTQILTWGFNGFDWDMDSGARRYSYFVPHEGSPDYGRPRRLIVLGQDIGSYSLQGYKNGGCKDGEEVDGIAADTRRYEATLGEVMAELEQIYLEQYQNGEYGETILSSLPQGAYLGLCGELLYSYGSLGDRAAMRYDMGMLEDIFSGVLSQDRVFYQNFSVTIPAGESVKVSAAMFKEASIDFACSGSDNVGVSGYDLVTTLGSALTFTRQTAALEHTDGIEILRQNFGFDLEKGITEVTLDVQQPHYYLELREVQP